LKQQTGKKKPSSGTAKPSAAKKAAGSKAAATKPVRSTSSNPRTGGSSRLAGRIKSEAELDEKFIKSSPKDASQMLRSLCLKYPDAHCELNFNSTFQLLISVILSAQTTDTGVNKVTPILFKRYPDAKALAEANIEDVKQIIRPTGYFNAKANNIHRCAQALVERHNGQVPSDVETLTKLPGVGRKTANVILGVAYDEPAWTVDTHVQRLSKRLGLTPETDPLKIEFDLQRVFPNQDWSKYSITLIWHGRRICFARKPNCTECPINHLCPSSQI
jgi:endonuclease-3